MALKLYPIGIQTFERIREEAKSSPDVFNPYSLLNCFAKRELGNYWFSSGTPTYLINMMRKFDTLPADIGRVEADESEFDAPTENMTTIMPLLYQSGYITIKDYNRDRHAANQPQELRPTFRPLRQTRHQGRHQLRLHPG